MRTIIKMLDVFVIEDNIEDLVRVDLHDLGRVIQADVVEVIFVNELIVQLITKSKTRGLVSMQIVLFVDPIKTKIVGVNS